MTEERLWSFDDIHPDPIIARDVVIETLMGALTEARAGLARALEYNAVTPNGISIKATVRWAIDHTSREAIESKLYKESV